MMKPRKPRFLEVFLPALCSDRLKIPTAFVKHLASLAPGPILLTGPSDNLWPVDLIERNGHLFFDDGWPTFVKDHAVQCGDSLVFKYNGNSHFSVQIFDHSSCEKEEAFRAKDSEQQSELNGNLGRKREREREASICDISVDKRSRGGLIPVHLDFPGGDRRQQLDLCAVERIEVEECIIHGNDNKMSTLTQAPESTVVLGLPAFPDRHEMRAIIKSYTKKAAFNINKACSKKKSAWLKNKSKKKKESQKKSSISDFVEARAAHYFTSNFPYFVRAMKYSNIIKGTLKIPVKFAKEHLPNYRTKVVLRNLDGKFWMLNFVPTARLNTVMYTFCGGWTAFVRCNGIKMEDVCIFELVDKLEMRVHILRLGSEGLESQIAKGGNDLHGGPAAGSDLNISENVSEDDGVHPLGIIERVEDQNINSDLKHYRDSEMVPGIQEAEYLIDTSDFISALHSPVNPGPFFLPEVHDKNTDHLLACDADGSILCQMGIDSGGELDTTPGTNMRLIVGDEKAAHSFTSPFPTFMIVMMSSNVGGKYSMAVPRKFSAVHLPASKTVIVLRNTRGDGWNVTSARYGLQTIFCGGWTSFVHCNGIKVGDICIFELIDDKVFQVHIFEGHQMGQKNVRSHDEVDDGSTTTVEALQYTHLP